MSVRTRVRWLVAAVALATVATACSPAPVGPGSRCTTNAALLSCPKQTTALFAGGEWREVHHQVPRGVAPEGGWPTVIMFQGTLATAALTWSASPLAPFGAYHQTQTVQYLLDAGFAVLTPETHLGGLTFWDTNNVLVPDYLQSGDHALMLAMFDEIDAGTFGDLDGSRLFATGISSGGYMTSRMALAYPGKFRALAIQSASYATCAGILCDVGPVPDDHPPTLFLHGALDPVVPIFTMDAYRNKLAGQGVATRRVVDTFSLHEWIPQAPGEIRAWFAAYR
jgi:poly(3-hydroxybutyrate) depolymerase